MKKASVSVSKYLACKGMKENDNEETKQRKAKDIIDTLDIDMDALNVGNHPKYLNRRNKWQAVRCQRNNRHKDTFAQLIA